MDTNAKKVDPVVVSKSDPQVEPQPVVEPVVPRPADVLVADSKTAEALTASQKTVATLSERVHYLEQRLAEAEHRLAKEISSIRTGPKVGDKTQGGTVVHATPDAVVTRGGDSQEWIKPTSG